jgi:cysteine desulfurase
VLTAMGLSPSRARGSVRFSLGIYNTAEEVDYLLGHLPKIIQHLRAEAHGKEPHRGQSQRSAEKTSHHNLAQA